MYMEMGYGDGVKYTICQGMYHEATATLFSPLLSLPLTLNAHRV